MFEYLKCYILKYKGKINKNTNKIKNNQPLCCGWLILPIQNDAKDLKMSGNPGIYGFSSESTQRELSNEYQHDRVKMVVKSLCILVLWTKVALALEGLR